MHLSISNLNIVGHADIVINGLAVIAGENGTGKSTIGKILFATIKTMADLRNNIGGFDRGKSVADIADPVFSRLFRLRMTGSYPQLDTLLPQSRSQFISDIAAIKSADSLDRYFAPVLDIISDSGIAAPLAADICTIREFIRTNSGHNAAASALLSRFLDSEFLGNIASADSSGTDVSFSDDSADFAISYSAAHGKAIVKSLTGTSSFRDATYIESPLYLHLLDILGKVAGARIFNAGDSAPFLPAHVADIVEKIESLRYSGETSASQAPQLSSSLAEIAGGEFYYDSSRHVVMFRQGDNGIVPLNVASGVKSLGLLQILLDNRIVTPDKPLIWDEPENHLHPKWQIRLAQFLVTLAAQGIPVIVSTHSPYFIQGIRHFAVKLRAEQFVDYYLAELNGNASVTQCVNDDLNRIFIKLASPLNEIMDLP